MEALTASEAKALVNGWAPRGVVAIHNFVSQPTGGVLSAVLADKVGIGAAAGIGSIIAVLDSWAGPSRPWIRTATQVGPGMLAGASALKTAQWIVLKKVRDASE